MAWLYYARIGHQVCALYDRSQAPPIRELSDRQRHVLAEGRQLAPRLGVVADKKHRWSMATRERRSRYG